MKITIDKKELLKKLRRGAVNRSLSTRVQEHAKRYKRAKQKQETLKEIKQDL